MAKEEFRKNIIKLLKTSRIYYINMFDELEEYKLKENIDVEINKINQDTDTIRNLYIMANAFSTNGIPHINYNVLEENNKKLIKDISNDDNIIDIKDTDTLEEIAAELSKIGEKEDFYYYYKYSKLKELKDVREKGTEATLKYIKENSKK